MQSKEYRALSHAEKVWNVHHPVLDRVRRCSAEPEKAAELFGMLLDPGLERSTALQALNTLYLKGLTLELQEHYKQNPLKPCKPRTSLIYVAFTASCMFLQDQVTPVSTYLHRASLKKCVPCHSACHFFIFPLLFPPPPPPPPSHPPLPSLACLFTVVFYMSDQ